MTRLQQAAAPGRIVLEGSYTRLEPLAAAHAEGVFAAIDIPDATQRYAYFPTYPPKSIGEIEDWIAGQQGVSDPIVFVVIDRATGRIGGWQQMMRIVPEHGVIEIGFVYWGPNISRTRVATEALYLSARHVFEDLGYRRFEWKCNDLNEPSKAAALRFGFVFEGVFRQHMITRGQNRDTAWFAMLDSDWPRLKVEYERWLAPENFEANGTQKSKLTVE